MNVNVASWNIWAYGKRDFRSMAKLIKKNKIDIIGIQEACIYFDRPSMNITKKIAKELGYDFVFCPAFDMRPDENHIIGNGIISRFPILSCRCKKLNPSKLRYDNTAKTEERCVAISKIKLNSGKIINFLSTHLQYSPRFKPTKLRTAQVKNAIAEIKKIRGSIVMAADLNSTPQNIEVKMMEKYLNRIGGNKPTWTMYPFDYHGWKVGKLKYRIDNIFLSRGLKHKNFRIIKSRISDHLPIMATIMV